MFIGLAFLAFSAIALFIPFCGGTHREDEPEVHRRFQVAYPTIGIVGH